ncbi:MAG: dephospho-CoA kinase [Methylobacteriaceae bacterium]|jgi:dephospho-CoA kinase|nr:dephospho-CoA kinase [Methylobacteriaceae bacterium]
MSFILGLTGSIAMGKSTTAGFFRELGIEVFDSDAVVHRLYKERGATLLKPYFPESVSSGIVDRRKLAAEVTDNPERLKLLESLVHPLVFEERNRFLDSAAARNRRLIVLDVPLLFETNHDEWCQAVAVVTASEAVQRQRALERPEMTEAKFMTLLNKQMPDREKRKRAHFIIDTGRGFDPARKQVSDIIRCLCCRG